MQLTKHRGEFTLKMSSEEVNVLSLLLKGYQDTLKVLADRVNAPTIDRKLEEYIHELTVYQREAYAYDQYLAEQEMGRNRTM